MSEAWPAVDDEAPVRLSEDGSGATFIVLAARGSAVVAASVDARTALTALHVRPVTFEGHAKLGEDVVVFVGGPGERRMTPSLVLPASGPAWALLPIAKDVAVFGMAEVRVDDPAKVDEPSPGRRTRTGSSGARRRVRSRRHGVGRARPAEGRRGRLRPRPRAGHPAGPRSLHREGRPGRRRRQDHGRRAPRRRPGRRVVAWVDGAGSWLERVACK